MDYYFGDQLRWTYGFDNPNKAAARLSRAPGSVLKSSSLDRQGKDKFRRHTRTQAKSLRLFRGAGSVFFRRFGIIFVLALFSCVPNVRAYDGDRPFQSFNEWLAAIPQTKFWLHVLVSGKVDDQCFAILKSEDGKIAPCFYNLKTGWKTEMSYDIQDGKGNSLFYGGQDPRKKGVTITRVLKLMNGADTNNWSELFGWAEYINNPKHLQMYLVLSRDARNIVISIPDF